MGDFLFCGISKFLSSARTFQEQDHCLNIWSTSSKISETFNNKHLLIASTEFHRHGYCRFCKYMGCPLLNKDLFSSIKYHLDYQNKSTCYIFAECISMDLLPENCFLFYLKSAGIVEFLTSRKWFLQICMILNPKGFVF